MIIKVFLFLLYCKSIFLSIICIIIYRDIYYYYIIVYHMIRACLFFKCRLVSYITSISLYILCIITVACYHFRLIFVINKAFIYFVYVNYFLY